MPQKPLPSTNWISRVVLLSLLLMFFTIPHTLEDFATGAPAEAGLPASLLSFVISVIFFFQAAGLYWLGQGERKGLWVHLGLGLFWPLASGFAQLPSILGDAPYRDGFSSVLYVLGMIVIGILLAIASFLALRATKK